MFRLVCDYVCLALLQAERFREFVGTQQRLVDMVEYVLLADQLHNAGTLYRIIYFGIYTRKDNYTTLIER